MKIFISHSSEDNSIVTKIVKTLEEYNIDHWVDNKELAGEGHSIGREINVGLENCSHFLLVWSQYSRNSKWVKKEYNAATSRDYDDLIVKIIFRLDKTLLPPLLADFKYHSVNDDNVGTKIIDVVESIKEKEDMFEEFDSYLDEVNGDTLIDGIPYPFSHVLKSVDNTRYKMQYKEWKSGELERQRREYL